MTAQEARPGGEVEPLPLSQAIPLAAAAVQEAAAAAGVRALVIKGVTAEVQLLRPAGRPTDVDVLVAPGDVAPLLHALRGQGWVPRPDDNHLGIFPEHSVTVMHPQWPCDLDVHHRYPGLDAHAPKRAFDRLWSDHAEVEVAHWPVAAPSRAAHAVILALTSLREPWDRRADGQLRFLVDEVLVTPELRDRFIEVGLELNAGAALAPLLQDLCPDRDWSGLPAPDDDWLLYTHSRESATLRLAGLAQARGLDRVRHLWEALAPSRTALASQDLSVADAGLRSLWLARWRRLRRGVRAIPTVLEDYRSYRRLREGVVKGRLR
ncbi:nucleotidyltransferase family protein [Micrococcus luteus]|nr:nucleotidyltransferase family protein [Micrococcus luteus]